MQNYTPIIKRSINLSAARIANKSNLIRLLEAIPNSSLSKLSLPITFSIKLDNHGSILKMDFKRDSINMEFESINAEVLSVKKTSIIILSILAFLDGVYEIKLNSKLYNFLITGLLESESNEEKDKLSENSNFHAYAELKSSNINLAKSILEESKISKENFESIAKYNSIISSISKFYLKDQNSIDKFCASLNIDKELIEWAIKNLEVIKRN